MGAWGAAVAEQCALGLHCVRVGPTAAPDGLNVKPEANVGSTRTQSFDTEQLETESS